MAGMSLTDAEMALLIAALEISIDGLTEGAEAAARRNWALDPKVTETAQRMRDLRAKLQAL